MSHKKTQHHYAHPNPRIASVQHYVALLLLIVIPVSAVGLLLLAIALKGVLFGVMVPFLLLLIAPVILLTSATPPVTLNAEGITVKPRLWGEYFIGWEDVQALRSYPLLPRRDLEVERRALQGRNKYQVAQGVMLLVPELPLPYRVTGFFAGARGVGVVAMTNRTHERYDTLEKELGRYLAHCDERDNHPRNT